MNTAPAKTWCAKKIQSEWRAVETERTRQNTMVAPPKPAKKKDHLMHNAEFT